jgi:phosphotriesterase-related protein
MAWVRTVLGDVEASALGVCSAHEHLIIDPSFTTYLTPDFLLDSVDLGVEELARYRQAGGRAMVDSMPGGGAGRNVVKLAELSQRSGIHIVCPTGLHLSKYYPPGHWSGRLSEAELAALFIGEIEQGIDINDLAGPELQRSGHRAGVIKVASGGATLSAQEQKLFRAAAQAHRATGCPILTHTEQGQGAMEQIELFAGAGVDLAHVVLSHTDRQPELAYHQRILRTGVKVEYDSAFRWKPAQPNFTFDLLVQLLAEFPGQIMLGMDAARRGYWRSYGGAPGLEFLLAEFTPRLRAAGLGEELLQRLWVQTPAETFCFKPITERTPR